LLNNIYIIAGDSDVNIVLNYDNEIISNETYVLQKGAKLKINTIATPSRLKYINRQFYLQDNAQLNCSIDVSSNGLFEMRNFYNLEGYGSSVSERGAFILHNKETARMFTQLNHIGQNTKGDSHMRGVLFGNASASIEGMAKIFLNAKGTDSYLNQHAMLLSKNAKAYTFPSLEIENNDVKAKHSASVSQIDEEQLFYMMSRGLSRADTIKEIISGFLASTIDIRKVAEFESIISKVTV
jgi:Fe-S cluster assembly scaffold protein SufB